MTENNLPPIAPSAMDSSLYYTALGYVPEEQNTTGGQALLLADIIASLHDCRTIYVPFNCPVLEEELPHNGIELVTSTEQYDAVYWGTPTIVNDKVLFPECLADPDDATKWNVNTERGASQFLTASAEAAGAKRIITGLGTGDIKVPDRIFDMGGGEVVSYKKFESFEDWLIVRNLV